MRNLILLGSSLLLMACGTEPDDLRLTLSLDRESIARDDSVRVDLTLTNVSVRPVRVLPANAYGFCNRAFEVVDATEREVSVFEGLCVAMLSVYLPAPVELAPGGRIEIRDWWVPARSRLDGQAITSGVYRLRGRAWARERIERSPFQTVMVH